MCIKFNRAYLCAVVIILAILARNTTSEKNEAAPRFAKQISGIISSPGNRHPKLKPSRPPGYMTPPLLPDGIEEDIGAVYEHARERGHSRGNNRPVSPNNRVLYGVRRVTPTVTLPNNAVYIGVRRDTPAVNSSTPVVSNNTANDRGSGNDSLSGNMTEKPINHKGTENINNSDHDENHDNHDHGNHSHDHGVDHYHLDRVQPPEENDFGDNIKPLNSAEDIEMTHHHLGADIYELMDDNRTERSRPDSADNLCSICLCNKLRTSVSCVSGNVEYEEPERIMKIDAKLIPPNAEKLEFRGFKTLIIAADTFAAETSKLRQVKLKNTSLDLEEHSLHFSPNARRNMQVTLIIQDCTIPIIPSYAFTQVKVERHLGNEHDMDLEETRFINLKIYDTKIGEMESHAFSQARILKFLMSRVSIDTMSQKSIDLDIYHEWLMQGSSLPHLPRNAICIHADNSVVFSGNVIKEIDSYAFNIEAIGKVSYEFNTVSVIRANAFLHIIPMRKSRSANLVFLNNTVEHADEDSLVTSDLYNPHERNVLNNKFKIICECNISSFFKGILDIQDNYTYDILMYEGVMLYSMCIPYEGSPHYIYVNSYLDKECSILPMIVVITVSVCVAILLISIIVAVVCARRASNAIEEASYIGECSAQSFSTMNTHAGPRSPDICRTNVFYDTDGNPSWIMAVPEVKTYQETEVHVTYEESHPIQPSARNSYQDPHMLELQRRNLTRQSCPFN